MAVTDVVMPLMGEGITEAVLVKWLKKPGDTLRANEPLLEVSTDKVDTEIPAPVAGTLIKILAEEGATIKVNALIAVIGEGEIPDALRTGDDGAPPAREKVPSPLAAAMTGATAPAPAARPAAASRPKIESDDPIRSSPLVRKIAAETRVDLRNVSGTGLLGRITKRDVEHYLERGERPEREVISVSAKELVPVQLPAAAETFDRLKTNVQDGLETLDGVPVRREKMSRMRTLIAKHMVESVRVSPHVTTVFEIDMVKVVAIREKTKAAFEAREGFKLTYTPFLIHAAAEALKAHPIINTSIDGDDILYKKDINIGCAVALGNGLIVPVIKKAGELSLLGICRRLNDLVSRARTKKLTPEDVQGGTFSITNPGGYGSLTSNPIINQPQVAIMGIGTIVKRAVVLPGDAIAIRPMILISLTFDHRVVDGEQGAKFLQTLKDVLESYSYLPS